jgi:hypothetical protein
MGRNVLSFLHLRPEIPVFKRITIAVIHAYAVSYPAFPGIFIEQFAVYRTKAVIKPITVDTDFYITGGEMCYLRHVELNHISSLDS